MRGSAVLMRLAPVAALCALALSAVLVSAQQRGRSSSGYVTYCYSPDECPRTPYDGRFTFVRVYFDQRGSGFGGFRGGSREPMWHHDRPNAERNLSAIMREISFTRTFDGPTGGNVFALTDPEIFRYPVIWMAEPGFWMPTEEEVESLRAYLLKGGFMIFDDFSGRDMYHLAAQLQRVLPELQPVRMTGDEPIFKAFFDIELDALAINRSGRGPPPEYWGLFEDNDPAKRQLVIMNNNNDIGEFIDYDDTGFFPVDLANEAYKLGVNYMIYAMTH